MEALFERLQYSIANLEFLVLKNKSRRKTIFNVVL